MSAQELREKSAAELQSDKKELLQEQFNLRMQRGMGQNPKPHLFKRVRKGIARLNTILNEKERQNG